jgi:hypothetical protein
VVPRLIAGILKRFRSTMENRVALRNVHLISSLKSIHANAPATAGR